MIDFQSGIPWETVTLTTIGRNQNLFTRLLIEAKEDALLGTEGKTIIYTGVGSEWRQFGFPKRHRPLQSVILDDGICSKVVADLKEFISSAQWYTERGIPYRRGYLLYGPPGCGKSSFINAIAGELEYSICLLSLSDKGLSDDRLQHLLSIAPHESIILLEDIDAAFHNREVSEQVATAFQGLSKVTLSGLLNALDGVASAEGQLIFMTTNYLDRLDPALIRPGRVDVKLLIDYASEFQLQEMFAKFYPETSINMSRKFAESLKCASPISLAAVQGYFLIFKDRPEDALQNVHLLSNI